MTCDGDKLWLRILLKKRIDNTWKFTNCIDIANIEVGTRMLEKKNVFYVKDNGVGFEMNFPKKYLFYFTSCTVEATQGRVLV